MALIAAVALVAALLVGFGVRSVLSSDESSASSSDGGQSASQDSDGSGSGDTEDSSESPDMDEGQSTAEADSGQQDADEDVADPDDVAQEADDEAPEALARCYAQVTAGEGWADATATSAGHWKRHYMASVDYNAGTISLEEAEREFAATKAKGETDMEAVDAAMGAYADIEGACAGLAEQDVSQTWAEDAQACQDRADAIERVMTTGSEVNDDWAEHLEMMRRKDEIDPEEYYERWRAMVKAAPENMQPYEDDAAALAEAASCSV